MRIPESEAVISHPAAVYAGDILIEFSSVESFDIQTMPYGYLTRICGNGFETLLSRGYRFSDNPGDWPALLAEAKAKARNGELRYIRIFKTDGRKLIIFNVGTHTSWDMLLKELRNDVIPKQHKSAINNTDKGDAALSTKCLVRHPLFIFSD